MKHHHKYQHEDPLHLAERFYRYGIRPEWLQIHHVVDRRNLKDGTLQYFIKWRDLPYVDCSWEDEDMEIPDYQQFIQVHIMQGTMLTGTDLHKLNSQILRLQSCKFLTSITTFTGL